MNTNKPILLVEDDSVDVMIVERALKEVGLSNRLRIASDGEEALEYLREKERPCMILLDLNTPRMNGLEFLEIVKKDDLQKGIPVVILTSSNSMPDKIHSFELGVAGYIVKSPIYEEFVDAMATFNSYWSLSELPE
jgi:CheY-like chemotaxis protein